ncbi:UDP-phosphate N-acetylgalactosaminyl-1-phosphate transferase [Brochothrix thermosphacta]|uniref:sugar transferase n=1 Tax=Brochothrix thermosphacta TaxID=2756 RepID=UPI00083F9C97|nr:sugar transferase [Brochothrix thermosphacta]ODJ55696.1 UDP-phosphate N-acetylgalactosaminyl-1-phosphate transferase [Brochothrix thermosphacta]
MFQIANRSIYNYTKKIQHLESVHTPYIKIKRFSDVSISLLLFILTAPIILIAGIAIRIESKGSMFYRQERVGFMGRPIIIIKLRSMYTDAEKNGAQWAKEEDSRVTKIGAFIRKTRIDELPQLLNVIRGDMSLIGPRPERPIFTHQFCAEDFGFERRLVVKPGLSGWAQVNGGYDITPKEKLQLDVEYIRNYGLKMDMQIFFKTIKVVFNGDGAR